MARLMEVFSPAEDPNLHERVGRAWEFVKGFPLPKFDMLCPCGSTDVKVSAFTFCQRDRAHITQIGGMAQGCDMVFRCRTCSRFQYYSVATSPEIFALRSHEGRPKMYHWEKALGILRGEDG